jgi:hypothetical protein
MHKKNENEFEIRTMTEYQLHMPDNACIDYTERRLLILEESTKDNQQRHVLHDVIERYLHGHIVVAWRAGNPVWLNLKREE